LRSEKFDDDDDNDNNNNIRMWTVRREIVPVIVGH